MSNRHIKTCQKFLEDKGFISRQTLCAYINASMSLQGEMAQLSFEQEFLKIIESPTNPWIDVFELELMYRKRNKINIYDSGVFSKRCERGIKTWIKKILIRSIN